MPLFIFKLVKNKINFPNGTYTPEEIEEMVSKRVKLLTLVHLLCELVYSLIAGAIVVVVLYYIAGQLDILMFLLGLFAVLGYWILTLAPNYISNMNNLYKTRLMEVLIVNSIKHYEEDDENES